jgi:putative transcriptional regulator
MTTQLKFKSDAFEAIHSAALALHQAESIDKVTLRDFDVACLAIEEPARQAQGLRLGDE